MGVKNGYQVREKRRPRWREFRRLIDLKDEGRIIKELISRLLINSSEKRNNTGQEDGQGTAK